MQEIEVRKKEKGPLGKKQWIVMAILIVVAVSSFFWATEYATNPDNHKATIQSLDDKRETVLKLTAASAATSAAITLLPGDAGTTIAEKLMDLSSYFLIVLCALFLEKYLVTITGYATFRVLIPAACLLLVVWLVTRKEMIRTLAIKAILIGLSIYLVVPVSVRASDIIEKTYKASIEETIDSATDTSNAITKASKKKKSDSDTSWWDKFLKKVKNTTSEITDKIGSILNNFIEALAVLIVTSCVIPILVLVFFVWLIKSILGVDFQFSSIRRRG